VPIGLESGPAEEVCSPEDGDHADSRSRTTKVQKATQGESGVVGMRGENEET
jgi:hypothetical protein